MDWLKGLKENVLLSRMIPAGMGLKSSSFFWIPNGSKPLLSKNQQNTLKKIFVIPRSTYKKSNSQDKRIFSKGQAMACLFKPSIRNRDWLHTSLKQLTEQPLNYEENKFCFQQLTENFFPRKREIFY